MIGHRQRHSFGIGEFRMVAGIVAISAVRNISLMAGGSHFRQLCRCQPRLIAVRTPSLAGFQILAARVLCKIGGLRKAQKRPETKTDGKRETGRRCPKTLPLTHVHVVRLPEGSSPRCREAVVDIFVALTGTGLWFRSATKLGC